MKFRDILDEKFMKTVRVATWGSPQTVEIFVNPSASEVRELEKDNLYDSVRGGIVDKTRPIFYAWDASIEHRFMERKLDFDIGFGYDGDNRIIWTHKINMKSKNIQQIFKKFYELFPKATHLWVTYPRTVSNPLKRYDIKKYAEGKLPKKKTKPKTRR